MLWFLDDYQLRSTLWWAAVSIILRTETHRNFVGLFRKFEGKFLRNHAVPRDSAASFLSDFQFKIPRKKDPPRVKNLPWTIRQASIFFSSAQTKSFAPPPAGKDRLSRKGKWVLRPVPPAPGFQDCPTPLRTSKPGSIPP